MPLLGTRGAASARGFGFGSGASVLPPIPDASLDISQFTYVNYLELNPAFVAIALPTNNPYVFTMDEAGKYFYINDYGSDTVYQFTLGTPFNIATATTAGYKTGFIGVGQGNGHMGMTWEPNGTFFIIGNYASGPMVRYNVSTPWMVDTITSSTVGTVLQNVSSGYTRTVSRDGRRIILQPGNAFTTFQYEASTAWDVTSFGGTETRTSTINGGGSSRYQSMFSYEGQWFFAQDDRASPPSVRQYPSASAFNISNGGANVYTYTLPMPEISAVDADPRLTELVFVGGQRYMFIMQQRGTNGNNRQIFCYAKLT